MITLTRSMAIAALAALCFAVTPTSYAQATCSMATVAGDWGATLTGTILFPAPVGPVPAAAVVRYHASAAGALTGIELRNVGGQFVKETLKGTGTVNANCVGTATVNIYQGGALARTVVLSLVYDELSTQVRMVQQSLRLPDGTEIPVVVTVEGKKLTSE